MRQERYEALRRELRKEPLTQRFLRKFFSSPQFSNVLSEMYRRAHIQKAEGGFVVYKKANSDDFKLVRRYGTSYISQDNLSDSMLMARDDPEGYVSMHDSDNIPKTTVARVGTFHFHPETTRSWFSEGDLEEYDRNTLRLGLLNQDVIDDVPRMYEEYELLGSIQRGAGHIELFGFSLPLTGLRLNTYQGREFETLESQEEALLACGFRVVKAIAPLKGESVDITPSVVEQLVQLGG